MLWHDGQQISRALETTFNEILATRMRDVPVINPVLSVQAVDFRRVNGDWLGVLITPWFMNLLLLPGADGCWIAQPPGSKFERPFPYGVFEFTVANEAQLGLYAVCSLFSPMFQFEDQLAAVTAAEAALQGLLASPVTRGMTRRDLLRGAIGNGIC